MYQKELYIDMLEKALNSLIKYQEKLYQCKYIDGKFIRRKKNVKKKYVRKN